MPNVLFVIAGEGPALPALRRAAAAGRACGQRAVRRLSRPARRAARLLPRRRRLRFRVANRDARASCCSRASRSACPSSRRPCSARKRCCATRPGRSSSRRTYGILRCRRERAHAPGAARVARERRPRIRGAALVEQRDGEALGAALRRLARGRTCRWTRCADSMTACDRKARRDAARARVETPLRRNSSMTSVSHSSGSASGDRLRQRKIVGVVLGCCHAPALFIVVSAKYRRRDASSNRPRSAARLVTILVIFRASSAQPQRRLLLRIDETVREQPRRARARRRRRTTRAPSLRESCSPTRPCRARQRSAPKPRKRSASNTCR